MQIEHARRQQCGRNEPRGQARRPEQALYRPRTPDRKIDAPQRERRRARIGGLEGEGLV